MPSAHSLRRQSSRTELSPARIRFTDSDADTVHDAGEPSEPFVDLNGNGKRDVQGELVSVVDASDDIDLMNAAWASACIEFRNLALLDFNFGLSLGLQPSQIGIFIEEPPGAEPFTDAGFAGGPAGAAGNGMFDFIDTNANGTHDVTEPSEMFEDCNANSGYDFAVNLVDGSLDEFADPTKPTREERTLVETLGDKKPETLDVFIVNALSAGSFGEQFRFGTTGAPGAERRRNTIIVQAASVGNKDDGTGKDFINTAHEAGHVLMDDGSHPAGDRTNMMVVPVAGDDVDGVNKPKRLTAAQAADARTDANTGVLRTNR